MRRHGRFPKKREFFVDCRNPFLGMVYRERCHEKRIKCSFLQDLTGNKGKARQDA